VNAEFNWWLLMVGLVVGAGLVWFVVADQRRREVDVDAQERAREALWLSASLADEGEDVSPETAERLLALHRAYLAAPPPDAVVSAGPPPGGDDGSARPDASAGPDASELPADDGRRVDRGTLGIDE
jgi:hypothetical protein